MIQMSEFEKKVKNLSDTELINEMTSLFQREKELGDTILLGLKELKQRRVFAAMGYPSLFEFLNKYFKLSESSCYQRVQALKLIESVDEAQENLLKGEVSLSNLASAQTLINQVEKATHRPVTAEAKKALLETIKGKSTREAKVALANSELAKQNPTAILPATKEKNLTENHTQLQLTLDGPTMATLKEIRDLLSHTIPTGDYSQIVKYLANHMVETIRKEKGRTLRKTESKTSTASDTGTSAAVPYAAQENKIKTDNANQARMANKPSRAIPIDIKRKVFQRADYRCEYIGTNGHRCNSQFQLEVDHIVPWSRGGTHDPEFLQALCRQHNLFRIKETHGFFYNKSGSAEATC